MVGAIAPTRTAIVLACLAWACADPPAPPQLLGGAHTDFAHLFTVRTPPVLRFSAPVDTLQAEWRGAGRPVLLSTTRDRIGGREVVRVHLERDTTEDGILQVVVDGHRWTWPGRFSPVGQRHPSVTDRPDDATSEARLATASPQDRPWLLAYRARTHRGAPEQAIALLEAASAAAARVGWRSEAGRLLQSAAHKARLAQRFAAATALLDRALTVWPHPTMEAFDAWHRGLIARDRGQLLEARARFLTAVDRLRAVGQREGAMQVDQNLEEMALAIGGRWTGLPPDPSRWPEVSAREWLDYVAMRRCAIEPAWSTLDARMSATMRRFADARMSAASRANLYANRALVREAMGDRAGARADLAEALARHPGGGLQPPVVQRLAARLAPPAEGVARLQTLLTRLERHGYGVEEIWQTRAALADALAASGRPAAANAQREAALALLETVAQRLELDRERSAFHAHRAHVVAAVVDTALRPGGAGAAAAFRVAEAHGAPVGHRLARLARLHEADPAELAPLQAAVRAIRGLEARLDAVAESERAAIQARLDAARAALRRARRRLVDTVLRAPDLASADAVLGALGPDEALLLLQPVRAPDCSVRWRSFWLADGQIATGPAEADPFARWQVAAAERAHVYVVGGAAAQRHAFEAQTSASVSRLPTASMLVARLRPAAGPPVVVGDPRGDLAGAHADARWLADRGARALIGAAATRAAFDAATADARWLHFAGHGVSDPADPLAAHLALADGPLPLSAILAARRPARTVILAGCETARSAPLSHLESLGLADAFLFAGARSVVAADYTVPDDDAGRFTRLFHLRDGPERPAAALREVRAMMALADDPAASGWHLFGRR